MLDYDDRVFTAASLILSGAMSQFISEILEEAKARGASLTGHELRKMGLEALEDSLEIFRRKHGPLPSHQQAVVKSAFLSVLDQLDSRPPQSS